MSLAPIYRLDSGLQGSKGPINCLVFSRDGRLLISGGVYVWLITLAPLIVNT